MPLILVAGLSGCAAMTTVAAIPGVMIEGVVNMFQGQERSMPVDMRTALVATQQGLRVTRLDVDVLEPVKDGYYIAFGNDKLDGQLQLTPQTPMLTTMDIKVHHGMSREESVEKTLMDQIQNASTHVSSRQSFDFKGYGDIRSQPEKGAKRLGWYRQRAKLEVKASRQKGWLSIKMPSGADGFVEGELPAVAGKN
ncbi:MAG TPA: hypothetical protein VNH42_04010 [Mariprofundaceae bacterium]|nr:hypothetical protein [Mariprofundaceae bacterium]